MAKILLYGLFWLQSYLFSVGVTRLASIEGKRWRLLEAIASGDSVIDCPHPDQTGVGCQVTVLINHSDLLVPYCSVENPELKARFWELNLDCNVPFLGSKNWSYQSSVRVFR